MIFPQILKVIRDEFEQKDPMKIRPTVWCSTAIVPSGAHKILKNLTTDWCSTAIVPCGAHKIPENLTTDWCSIKGGVPSDAEYVVNDVQITHCVTRLKGLMEITLPHN